MADRIIPQNEFLVIRKSELDDIIRALDHIGMALDFLLERQDSRRELAELVPHDFARQAFLDKQRRPS